MRTEEHGIKSNEYINPNTLGKGIYMCAVKEDLALCNSGIVGIQ